jgi:serine/threonine protein phosphatase PrpC
MAELRLGLSDHAQWSSLMARACAAAQLALEDSYCLDGATTFVAALARPGELVVVNVGDSRAYWIGAGGTGEVLSVDDTSSGGRSASGGEEAETGPGGRSHEITAWLGVDAGTPSPHVAVRTPMDGGYLVVCSDGLWTYAPSSQDVARLWGQPGQRSVADGARYLVDFALECGGADNVTVAAALVSAPESLQTPDRTRR